MQGITAVSHSLSLRYFLLGAVIAQAINKPTTSVVNRNYYQALSLLNDDGMMSAIN